MKKSASGILILCLALSAPVVFTPVAYGDQGAVTCNGGANQSGGDFSAGCQQQGGSTVPSPPSTGRRLQAETTAPVVTPNYQAPVVPDEKSKAADAKYPTLKDGDKEINPGVPYKPKGESCNDGTGTTTYVEDPTASALKKNLSLPVQSNNLQIACKPNKEKPGNNEQENNPDVASEAEQIAEIESTFAKITPPTPQLRLNDYPSPHTWIDENTHFYVEFGEQERFDGKLKAGHVQIEALPIHYTFETGDGKAFTTTNPGAPVRTGSGESMPKTVTGHQYRNSGNYHAYVTVKYTGRYRIGDGPWIPLNGEVTKTSEAALVRVWEVETHNVAKLCTEDPTAWACPGSKYRPDYNNPNPRLAVPDPHTGQQWHKDNAGSGDTEWWRKPAKKQTRSR